MIHSFKFSNIASFKKDNNFDLTWARKDNSDDTLANSKLPNVKVSKVATIIGPNASGKSNLLRGIAFLQYWIVDAWRLAPETPVSDSSIKYRCIPYTFADNADQHFECVFETKKSVYKIELKLKK